MDELITVRWKGRKVLMRHVSLLQLQRRWAQWSWIFACWWHGISSCAAMSEFSSRRDACRFSARGGVGCRCSTSRFSKHTDCRNQISDRYQWWVNHLEKDVAAAEEHFLSLCTRRMENEEQIRIKRDGEQTRDVRLAWTWGGGVDLCHVFEASNGETHCVGNMTKYIKCLFPRPDRRALLP